VHLVQLAKDGNSGTVGCPLVHLDTDTRLPQLVGSRSPRVFGLTCGNWRAATIEACAYGAATFDESCFSRSDRV
jgi:hypothetical protein